jgi:tryptophan synthase
MSLSSVSHLRTQLQTALRFRSQILFVPYLPIGNTFSCLQFTQQALKNGVTVSSTLEMVREARKKGLKVPVLFMGYYNPILSYGEERLLKDCKEAGINGFIVVDLPPEEAVTFRNFCTKGG